MKNMLDTRDFLYVDIMRIKHLTSKSFTLFIRLSFQGYRKNRKYSSLIEGSLEITETVPLIISPLLYRRPELIVLRMQE